jgi:tetratricopeptide (TPR) repeat protein
MLERFVTLYPHSPIADEASYSLANAYLDLDDFAAVVARTEELVRLFPDSKWLDRYRYLQALAWFSQGEFEKARDLAEKVAVATYRDEQGVERPSPNKWLAYYIIGQIYHAQRDTAKAIEYYKKVREHFSDAAEAIAQFEHKFVQLPEVTVFHPDDGGFREADEWRRHLRSLTAPPAHAEATGLQTNDAGAAQRVAQADSSATLYPTPFVRIDFRNIKTAVLQVYRVDLMKLALVEKNLSEITSVNLAGVKPLIEQTIPLGDGFDYADKMRRIALELQAGERGERKDVSNASDQEGAYLVICRGDDLISSGLVLVTPLVVEVQEDLASQRTRVSVVDAITRDGVKNVHVKVIGFGMDHFISGKSDLRGVYLADGVMGYPTAIARDPEGRFAFHRSEGAVLAVAAATAARMVPPPPQERAKSVDYRSNLYLENRKLQESNDLRLQSMSKQQQQKGVQVRETQ